MGEAGIIQPPRAVALLPVGFYPQGTIFRCSSSLFFRRAWARRLTRHRTSCACLLAWASLTRSLMRFRQVTIRGLVRSAALIALASRSLVTLCSALHMGRSVPTVFRTSPGYAGALVALDQDVRGRSQPHRLYTVAKGRGGNWPPVAS